MLNMYRKYLYFVILLFSITIATSQTPAGSGHASIGVKETPALLRSEPFRQEGATNGKLPTADHSSESKLRSLHYNALGTDFVTINGKMRFNRALYGTNTGFRIETGDLPEFAL